MDEQTIIEDNELIVMAPKKGFVTGHLVIIPKLNSIILEQVSDDLIKKMFQAANKLSSVLFDTLQCQGTNILIQNGVPAGQINEVFSINIIPRFENDNLKLEWEAKQATKDQLETILKRFNSLKEEETQKKIIEEKKKTASKKNEEILKNNKDNYLIRSLIRNP